MISDATVFRATPDLAVVELDGEAVVLSPQTGTYFGLNEVAARLLDLAKSPCSLAEVLSTLLGEYEVDADVLRPDVVAFLTEMTEAGLVELVAAPTSDVA